MELTPLQYKDIEQLSAINYSVKQIAMYLDVSIKLFEKEFYNTGSKVKITDSQSCFRAHSLKLLEKHQHHPCRFWLQRGSADQSPK